jgi:hypothetical protein
VGRRDASQPATTSETRLLLTAGAPAALGVGAPSPATPLGRYGPRATATCRRYGDGSILRRYRLSAGLASRRGFPAVTAPATLLRTAAHSRPRGRGPPVKLSSWAGSRGDHRATPSAHAFPNRATHPGTAQRRERVTSERSVRTLMAWVSNRRSPSRMSASGRHPRLSTRGFQRVVRGALPYRNRPAAAADRASLELCTGGVLRRHRILVARHPKARYRLAGRMVITDPG